MKELDQVKAAYDKNGLTDGSVIEALKALREVYKAAGDPTLTKVCRLAYEHIEANNDFLIDIFDEEREAGDETSFAYFLSLMTDANNKFNREEIQEYKALLWDDLGY